MRESILRVEGLHGHYGESHVLHGMSFEVATGEVVTLLGRNGAGKTTTMRALMGLLDKKSGQIVFEGRDLMGKTPEFIARAGIALCPEDRAIFASLSVLENLMLPPVVRSGGMSVDEILALFPNLKARLKSAGNTLSGGEQQMLAIGRILRTGATLLLLDEPSEGLAPVIVEEIGRTIQILKERRISIVLVEQNFKFAAGVADRHYVVEHGQVVDSFKSDELVAGADRMAAYLSV